MERPERNPSRPAKRALVLLGALLGFTLAARLAAYQFRLAPAPFEPLFGDGSVRVLNSALSRLLPVPDAALGAGAYAVEALFIVVGKSDRFQRLPLVVLAYAALAASMGVASIGLSAYQLFVVHACCTLCLVSALLSVILVVPAASEARAAAPYLRRRFDHDAGTSAK